MAKEKIEITGLPEIDSIEPVGTQILIEKLTDEELAPQTKVYVPGSANKSKGAPQAYILKVGPLVGKEWNFKPGQRCVLSGSFVPVPEVLNKNGREMGLCEPHMIKAIIVEKK